MGLDGGSCVRKQPEVTPVAADESTQECDAKKRRVKKPIPKEVVQLHMWWGDHMNEQYGWTKQCCQLTA